MMLIAWSVCGYAQVEISGQVIDVESKKGIGFANIIVQNTKQTKMLTYAITNENGEYSFEFKD